VSFKTKLRQYKYSFYISLFVFVMLVLFLWPNIAISIHSGQSGVLYSRFMGGTVTDRLYGEGIHFIFPWDIMYIYDVRLQEDSTTVEVLSRDGLIVQVDSSIRYHITKNRLFQLHQRIGPKYKRKVVMPIFASSIRESVGQYRPAELYTTARQQIQDKALVEAVEEMGRIPIVVDSIIIKRIALPKKINKAIQDKLVSEQQYLRYRYLLLQAKEEVKRKYLEAEGIRLYQSRIQEGLTENFLRWRGIQATEELAKSTNAKVVVVGGKEGLPLILNTGDQAGGVPTPKPSQKAVKPATGKGGKSEPAKKDQNDVSGVIGKGNSIIDLGSVWENLKKLDQILTGRIEADKEE